MRVAKILEKLIDMENSYKKYKIDQQALAKGLMSVKPELWNVSGIGRTMPEYANACRIYNDLLGEAIEYIELKDGNPIY